MKPIDEIAKHYRDAEEDCKAGKISGEQLKDRRKFLDGNLPYPVLHAHEHYDWFEEGELQGEFSIKQIEYWKKRCIREFPDFKDDPYFPIFDELLESIRSQLAGYNIEDYFTKEGTKWTPTKFDTMQVCFVMNNIFEKELNPYKSKAELYRQIVRLFNFSKETMRQYKRHMKEYSPDISIVEPITQIILKAIAMPLP